jgi:hypothetical protein
MIITHPLWDKKKIAEEIAKITGATLFEVYDTFKLLRSDLKHIEFNAGLQEDPDDADEHVPAVAPIIDPDEFSTEEDDDDEPM